MSKTFEEIAAEITIATIKAKGEILASVEHAPSKGQYTDKWLGDEAITTTFKEVMKTLNHE
jgi:hypothetical protein